MANDLALVATLVLSDRIAIQLLLITPRQRSLLLLLQALLLVPLTEFFTLSWSVWALPALLISLYLQMLCYSRPDRLQRLTVAGLMMGIAVLLYPPLDVYKRQVYSLDGQCAAKSLPALLPPGGYVVAVSPSQGATTFHKVVVK